MRFINIAGLGSTGSSAVADLLKEYDNISSYIGAYTYEHVLMGHPDGVMETVLLLSNQFFGLQTDATIRRFMKKMNSILVSYGGKSFFSGKYRSVFEKSVMDYVQNISVKEGKCPSTVQEIDYKEKILKKIFKRIHKPEMIKRVYPEKYGWYTLKVDEEALYFYTKKFVSEYLNMTVRDATGDYYLLDGFVPFTYFNMMPLIIQEEFKNILVLRDPRDRYLGEAQIRDTGDVAIVPMDPVLYCQNYRCIMEKLGEQDRDSYCLVYFEDLIENYEETVKKLEEYLGIDSTHHNQNVGEIFNIRESCHNCRMYKQEAMIKRYSKELSIIEKELKEYLVRENDNR